MGSAIASPSTTPVAFVGRPHGPPRCKSAPLYHRAQVARPISQGLQGGETPFCAQLHPVAPPCARLRPAAPACARLCRPVPSRTILHRPAPSHPVPFAAQPRRTPVSSHSSPFRPAAPSHSSPFALQRHRTPAPSHSCTVTPRPFASSLSSSLPFVITTPCSPTHPHPDPDESETSHQNKNFAFFRSIFRLLAFSDSGSLPERHQRDQCGPEEEVWTLFARLHAIARLLKCRLLLTIATFEEK